MVRWADVVANLETMAARALVRSRALPEMAMSDGYTPILMPRPVSSISRSGRSLRTFSPAKVVRTRAGSVSTQAASLAASLMSAEARACCRSSTSCSYPPNLTTMGTCVSDQPCRRLLIFRARPTPVRNRRRPLIRGARM